MRLETGDWIVSGGCPQGGDRFAEILAKEKGIPIIIFYPNWKEFGRTAGFVRNTEIARWSDLLVACVAEDRIGGTEDTVKKFLHRNSWATEKLYLVEEGGVKDAADTTNNNSCNKSNGSVEPKAQCRKLWL